MKLYLNVFTKQGQIYLVQITRVFSLKIRVITSFF